MSNKTYFITGGGTGGHIYPAIAVADQILANDKNAKIYYIGNPNNLEYSITKDKEYEFLPVKTTGMPRKFTFKFVKWFTELILGWIKCCFYIKKYKPDIIFGTGGYVSAPVIMAGITMKTPFVMHDCDANPGLVTRKFAPYAKSISVAFDCAKQKIDNKNCFVNGNPIRAQFSQLTKESARQNLQIQNKLTLCIMGGSQGAKRINDAALELVKELSQKSDMQIFFQTGKKDYENTVEKLTKIYPDWHDDKNISVKPYYDDLVTVLKACDIVVSRAGSLSISEICASSAAPIFIPYPYAAANHQRINARYMVENGAGLYLEDENTTGETLFELLNELISNPEKLNQIQTSVAKLAKTDGAERITEQIEQILNG